MYPCLAEGEVVCLGQTSGRRQITLSKQGKHEALADIHESIEELRYYREHFLKV